MAKHAEETRGRVNLVLGRNESEWLDQLAAEILASSGAKVSRSEIASAAIATFRELHRLVPSCRCPAGLIPLGRCKSGTELVVAGLLAIRLAATL